MPKVRASSGIDRTMWRPISLLRSSVLKSRTNAIVVDASAAPGPLKKTQRNPPAWNFQGRHFDRSLRHESA